MAIQLDRLAGQSYDEGEQMTMAEALQIAQEYNAVPQRISSGVADPNTGYSGVWAIPTANGFIPLSRGGSPAGQQAAPAQQGQNASQAPSQQQSSPQQMPPGWSVSPQQGPMSTNTPLAAPPSMSGSGITPQQAWSRSGGPQQSLIGPQGYARPQGPPTANGTPPAYMAAPAQGSSTPVNINVNVPQQNQPSNDFYSPSAQAQSYAGVYGLPYEQGQGATDAYRSWAGDQAGQFVNGGFDIARGALNAGQEMSTMAGMMGFPNPGQTQFPLGKTYGDPSAMNQPQYPYSPQFRSPYLPSPSDGGYQMGNSWSMGQRQGPQPFSPQLAPSWSNAGPAGFAGNAQWQGQRQAYNQLGIR